jgi:hypothetical protein
VPPHAVDAALTAYRDEGRRLAAAVKGIEMVEGALRGAILLAPRVPAARLRLTQVITLVPAVTALAQW